MREWFTADELAELNLPGLPDTKRGINDLAARQSWAARDRLWSEAHPQGVWRKRKARGGGNEYHYSLLPAEAQTRLLADQRAAEAAMAAPAQTDRAEAWAYFDQQPEARRQVAAKRLAILDQVADLVRAGRDKDVAVQLVAHEHGLGISTIYGWQTLTYGLDRADWLPCLLDRRVGRTAKAEISPEAWELLKGLYLRLEKPRLADCYARLHEAAAKHGWTIPSFKTVERKVKREIDPLVILRWREGVEAVERRFPAQRRDRTQFRALEAVNFDGHKFDVFVRWADGEIGRPMMAAFQDLYSNKILGWRIDRSENAHVFRLAFGDVVEHYGIPGHVYLDNTRAAAAKWLTGGSPNRFRFKVRDDEPAGLFKVLGVEIHFTTPYHGQSKPIERAFGELANTVARAPDCAGAYTGNNPLAKPENYGSKAIPIGDFIAVVEREINRYNAKPGRATKVCGGVKSFDEAFAESHAHHAASIVRATAEQRRQWLMTAEAVTAREPSGMVHLMGNRYWCDELARLVGHKLVVRFDPDRLHDDVHVYRLDGSYVAAAACIADTGFADADAARHHARARRDFTRAVKAQAEAERRMDAAEAAALLPAVAAPPAVEDKVVRGRFGDMPLVVTRAGRAAAEPAPLTADQEQALAALAADLERTAEVLPLDTPTTRFVRAHTLEQRLAAGEAATTDELSWLAGYRRTPEYQSRKAMMEDFGEDVLTA